MRSVGAVTSCEPHREVWSAAARDHGADAVAEFSRSHECGRSTGARAEVPHCQLGRRSVRLDPLRHPEETLSEQGDVEHVRPVGLFVRREEVEQQRRDAGFVQDGADVAVPGAVATAAAPVGEEHDCAGTFGHDQIAGQADIPQGSGHGRFVRGRIRCALGATPHVLQALDHFVVGRLSEVVVELPDSEEGLRRCDADELVSNAGEPPCPVGRGDWHRENDPSAPSDLATAHAALAVDPVATPSSTMITTLPVSGIRGRSPLNRIARRLSSSRCSASTAANSRAVTWAALTTSWLTTLAPPSPMAPMASSGWTGTPSLRTTITSSGERAPARPRRRPVRHLSGGRRRLRLRPAGGRGDGRGGARRRRGRRTSCPVRLSAVDHDDGTWRVVHTMEAHGPESQGPQAASATRADDEEGRSLRRLAHAAAAPRGELMVSIWGGPRARSLRRSCGRAATCSSVRAGRDQTSSLVRTAGRLGFRGTRSRLPVASGAVSPRRPPSTAPRPTAPSRRFRPRWACPRLCIMRDHRDWACGRFDAP